MRLGNRGQREKRLVGRSGRRRRPGSASFSRAWLAWRHVLTCLPGRGPSRFTSEGRAARGSRCSPELLALQVVLAATLCALPSTAAAQQQKTEPPGSFEAIARSAAAIRCYWLPAAGCTGYKLSRDGAPLTTLPAGATTYLDTGLAPDSTHTYGISAEYPAGEAQAPAYAERTFAPFPRSLASRRQPPVLRFDVVVAQASSSGVAAAAAAASRGLRVALIEPTTRLGGMPVNGLCATDIRRPQHASGFLTLFRDRVKALYKAGGISATGLAYSPRIAEQAMKSILYEVPNLTIYRRARLRSVHTVSGWHGDRHVDWVDVAELGANGEPDGHTARFEAPIFIDATDCGDLSAWAGAPFRVGREPRTVAEPHAGIIYYDRAADKLLAGSTGRGDRRIQSYAYLLAVKDYGPGTDHTIPKPPGYSEQNYIHTPPWNESWAVTSGRAPGGIYELNQHPQGNDWQGINYRYPLDDYAQRARIEQLYRNHVLGYLYYIETAQGQRQIGLPDDEYRDSGGFPPLLYVREGRRILGEQLPLEADIANSTRYLRPESIGIGDYPMDSHACEPKRDWNRPDNGEGEWWLYRQTPIHQLPMGILIPRRLDNVIVTMAVSSTHVSFGTYRLEPVRMEFGEAAGAIAWLALRYRRPVPAVPVRQAQEEMLLRPAPLAGDGGLRLVYYSDLRPDDAYSSSAQFLATRGFTPSGPDFKPGALTTRDDLARWLRALAGRAAAPPKLLGIASDGRDLVRAAFYPYMGSPVDATVLAELGRLEGDNTPVTRAEAARWLASLLRWKADGWRPRYADITDSAVRLDAWRLEAHGIDPELWDGPAAVAADARLLFRPSAPLTRGQMMATLYRAQMGLGPLFNDNPADGSAGWPVPGSPMFDELLPAGE